MIQLKADYDVTRLPVFLNSVTGPFFTKAMGRALNKAIVAVQKDAVLITRDTVQLRRKSVTDRLKLWKTRKGSSLNDLDAQLTIMPTPISLSSYPYKNTVVGYTLKNRKPIYSVAVNVKAGFKTIKSAFVAETKTGSLGIFMRQSSGTKLVARKPIEFLRGPSLGDIFSEKSKTDRLTNVAQKELGDAVTTAFKETIDFAMEKAGSGF